MGPLSFRPAAPSTCAALLVHSGGGLQLYTGDSLQLLPSVVGTETVSVTCTDPPYSSGGLFRGDRTRSTTAKYVDSTVRKNGNVGREEYTGDNRDQLGMLYWSALWCSEVHRATIPGGLLLMFCDWRQITAAILALQAGGFIFRGIVPWDKTTSARPQSYRFRNQCEFVVWGSKGPMPGPTAGAPCLPGFFTVEPDGVAELLALEALAELEAEAGLDVDALPGVVRCRVSKEDKELHEAGKPLGIFRELLQIAPPGGLILDPFMGSGPCGVVAWAEMGLPYVGMEFQHGNTLKAQRRILGAQGQLLAAI